MKRILMITLGMLMLFMLTFASMFAQKKDSIKKAQPFVKELPGDTTRFKTPVQRLDTLRNNMPVVDPKKNNVTPK